MKAADQENWPAVERAMLRAIQKDSQESPRRVAIVGMRFESYLPYVYLGLAHYRQYDYEGARRAWLESTRQGAVYQWRDAEEFHGWWQNVLARTGPVPPPPPPPPPTPPPALRLEQRLVDLERTLRKVGPPTTSRMPVLFPALEALRQAREAHEDPTIPAEAVESRAKALEAAISDVAGLAEKPSRRAGEIADNLRELAGQLRESARVLPPQVEERLAEVEFQLSLNKPDVSILIRHEPTLLCSMFPLLKQVYSC